MIAAIVQARMGSSRLPGKTLADIGGEPMLWHVCHRVEAARLVDLVIVATTDCVRDDPIAVFCQEQKIACFRGSEPDVLDRFSSAAQLHKADIVVRVTADCPLIDPRVIDRVVQKFQATECDYASNTLRYTYPDGLDVEVFSFDALARAGREARKPAEREHVTPYLRTGRFRAINVENEFPVEPGTHRWTVDNPQDLRFVREIYASFAPRRNFDFREVLSLLKERPELATIQTEMICNAGYYRSLYRQAAGKAAPRRNLAESQKWLARSKQVIPGATQTFSKKYNQYIQGAAPTFLERGAGCQVWDVDGNEYIDYVQGLMPNILGYAHPEVNAAACKQLARGHSFSLPHPLEVELAERLTALIPCAEMVRFGKNGSDATSGAIRAARAYTGRDRVACCGYHGWQDWYIGSTTRNAGVPASARELTHPFKYNDLASLEDLLERHPGEFAAVIMEPMNFQEPVTGFLEAVRDLAHKHSAVLIFDEICSGFHFGLGGMQKVLGVTPDMACFGKAMGNGFPISCVVGRADLMQVFDEIFFSFTFAGETASMAAAMKVLDILEQTDALASMEANGLTLQEGVNTMAREAGLFPRIECVGRPQWSLVKFRDAAGNDSPLLKNLFQQEAVKRGVLILATHNMSAAHDSQIIFRTLGIYAEVLKALAAWLEHDTPSRFLEGEMSQPVFRVR